MTSNLLVVTITQTHSGYGLHELIRIIMVSKVNSIRN